jgi:hypothetical protein
MLFQLNKSYSNEEDKKMITNDMQELIWESSSHGLSQALS